MSMIKKNEISYKQEILRKGIHLCSLSMPIGYAFINKETFLSILIPITIIVVLFDILSYKVENIRKLINYLFGKMLRVHELQNKKLVLTGASWVLISAVINFLVFPKIIAITGFSILIISDTLAALYGRKYGKTPFFDKSLEGSLAFAISAIAVVFFVGFFANAMWTFFLFGLIGALAATLVEAASTYLRIDDNLTIPICFGIVVWILGEVFFYVY